MTAQHPRRLGCVIALLGAAAVSPTQAQRPDYPPTRVAVVTDVVHGVTIEDPYRWLESSDDPEVRCWTEQQNALTRRYLDQFQNTRQTLSKRLTKLYSAATVSSPRVFGERYFFTKREGEQNHSIVYVKEGGIDAEPRAVLNPNQFSQDGTTALDWWFPSPDGALIAYGKSCGGDEKSTLLVRDVTTGEDRSLAIPYTRSNSVAWDADGRGFYYLRFPEPGFVPAGDENYYRHVYYHKLDTDWREDPKVFGQGRPKEEWPRIRPSSDYRYLLLTIGRGWSEQDLYIRRADEEEFRPVAVGLRVLLMGDVLDDKLYLLTNHEAPRYRVVVTDPANPGPETWKDVIPEQKGVIESMKIVGGKLIVSVMENAYSRLCVYEIDGKMSTEIELPTLGSVSDIRGRHDVGELFFQFESFTHPPTVFRYDLGTHQMIVVDRMEVDLDLSQYETKQVWFNSKDGTRVPMFVIHKQGLELNGNSPTVLCGYGGFNNNVTPSFLQHPLPFLDAGGVYALANLRGGGEFGEEWHQAGQLENKQNVFDDMIAACEKLIADKYTRPERLALRGGSNGGLLVGAMITQRPDLFRAAYCAVPLLDMVRYHRFSIARLWIPEYGSAEDPEQFKYLHAYSPYHHVRPGVKYPAVLFTTAESDSRVDPMHARKMTALMQVAGSSDNPILLWVEQKAGHGKGKPLRQQIAERVDSWVFFMWQLGMLNEAA
ncbi:MAG: prolyl oligopeptidase family serine peptidase [Planctomycetes bacterium]|nr:prolyl oligopeptidase family serine peptidase [Planctomycetota bacterium]